MYISNTHSVVRHCVVVVARSPQASRQTREFVWQEKESLGSAATASETIMSTSKSKCPSKTPQCFSKNIQPLHFLLMGTRGPCDQTQTPEGCFPSYKDHKTLCLFTLCRTLTDRQRALLMSYAEDETDVEGTVNGVTATTTGNRVTSYLWFWNWALGSHLFSLRPGWCSVDLCPGGGSGGKPSGAGESRHDRKEGDLKQEGGFFSKLMKVFSSSWQPQTR